MNNIQKVSIYKTFSIKFEKKFFITMIRPLFGIEQSFANPYYSSFVQFSIRVNDQSKVKKNC